MISNIFKLARPYFTTQKTGFVLLILLCILECVFVLLNVEMTNILKRLYDALELYDRGLFQTSLIEWTGIFLLILACAVIKLAAQLFLTLKWRTWMTDRYLNVWTSKSTFYGNKIISNEVDNPDQRITEDINSLTSFSINLLVSLISIFLNLFFFIPVLWNLVEPISFSILGYDVVMHGYLVWFALGYAIVATMFAILFGRPFSKLFFEQEKREAYFRFDLMRIREYAESIALYKAGDFHYTNAMRFFSAVKENLVTLIKYRMGYVTFLTAYKNLDTPVVMIALAPLYFAKTITLGVLMQTSRIFSIVNDNFSWVIDSYLEIAKLHAVVLRLVQFNNSIEEWQNSEAINIHQEESDAITMQDICAYKPNGEVLFKIDSLLLDLNKHYLLQAASGSGKTTLMRLISGMYPFADGNITIPSNKKIAFIAQKSFFPIVSLKEAICYPSSHRLLEPLDDCIVKLMKELQLSHLIGYMDSVEDWGRVLSGGEQQRLAIIRVIIDKPDVAFFDESFSAMDDKALAISVISKHLPNMQRFIISHDKHYSYEADARITIEDGLLHVVE